MSRKVISSARLDRQTDDIMMTIPFGKLPRGKNHILPTTFDKFYLENRAFHQYQTRGANHLSIPIAKSRIATTFIKKSGISLWNLFSPLITPKSKFGLFKKEIINLLISKYPPPI